MKLFNRKYHQPGTQPGNIEATENSVSTIDIYNFSAAHVNEYLNSDISTCKTFYDNEDPTWIHIQGDPSSSAMKFLVQDLGMHELYVEDILNLGQRPKVDITNEYIFVILNLPVKDQKTVHIEQISLFLTKHLLISFATGTVNPFAGVIGRLKNTSGKLRTLDCDYLMYALIDTVIDFGFPLLETYSEQIQMLEDELLTKKNQQPLGAIHQLRTELLLIKRRLWPQRAVISELLRSDQNPLLANVTLLHLKDCHDHVISILEILETFHEMTSGLTELYLTTMSLKLNDVIKFLTIFTTVFIPPTFIVGVYGMNFSRTVGFLNMPELDWQYGYIAVWAVIFAVITGMLLFFWYKKWL